MKRLSVVLFASAVLFGMASCQANEEPVSMDIEPTATQPAVSGHVNPDRRVVRTGSPTRPGGDFFAGQ